MVLEVELESPGLVVLADVSYPGWQLTIDDKPARSIGSTRLMRGALVPAKHHRLVYTYAPQSFQIGLVVSVMGLAGLLLFGLFCKLRPVDHVLAAVLTARFASRRTQEQISTDQREVNHAKRRARLRSRR